MKKLIALLLTLSTLFAASCAAVKTGDDGTTETRKAPDEQTTAGDETTAEEQTTVDDVTTETGETIWSDPISIKLTSLEMQILYSDVIAKVTCQSVDKESGKCVFLGDELIYGELYISEIKLKNSKAADNYEVGKKYYMFLEYRYDAYMSEPLWLLMNERPIPLGDGFISSLKTFDWFKDDSKCSDVTSEEDFTKLIKEIVTTEEFKASRAKLIDVVNCPEDNALDDLVASAGVVLHVKVGEKIPYIINSVEDREHIFCTVVEDMKGNLPVGEEIDVLVRTADDLKAGDEVILLLLKDSFYIYSSRNSVRPLEEKDEIKALIANN